MLSHAPGDVARIRDYFGARGRVVDVPHLTGSGRIDLARLREPTRADRFGSQVE